MSTILAFLGNSYIQAILFGAVVMPVLGISGVFGG